MQIKLPHHRYEILIEPGVLGRVGSRLRQIMPHDRCGVVADRSVWALYGETLGSALASEDYDPILATIEPGESSKSLSVVEEVHGTFFDAHLERRSPIIALGGGVAGDIAGFVAATHLRGVPFVQCPTSLLAMVDSSVGGKTGVNVPQGKNLLGAFHQPILVAADPLVLSSLPEREFRCGLAECIKHAVIRDPALFEFMGGRMTELSALSTDVLVELIRRNVEIKAAVVMEDERERGVRAHLNFGHTYGHAIEACAGYGRVLHGEAVALGMVAAMRTAIEFGLCPSHLETELVELLKAAGLPVKTELPELDQLESAMRMDKKVAGDRVRLVLPTRIGEVEIRDDVPEDCVRAGWDAIRS
ncbi:MAG: 3-dehydroquinate synthase [Myxococcota bacterium]|nr:3-dehydroquinate synthase [Myxococcota bacterium]